MINLSAVGRDVSVAGGVSRADLATIAASGFRTVLLVRPDDESPDQASASSLAAAARATGLDFVHIPATPFELFCDEVVTPVRRVLEAASGPVLIACASGQRAAILWAAAAARSEPVAEVLAQLQTAGFDFAFLRDDLEQQADRARWSPDVEGASDQRVATSTTGKKAA